MFVGIREALRKFRYDWCRLMNKVSAFAPISLGDAQAVDA